MLPIYKDTRLSDDKIVELILFDETIKLFLPGDNTSSDEEDILDLLVDIGIAKKHRIEHRGSWNGKIVYYTTMYHIFVTTIIYDECNAFDLFHYTKNQHIETFNNFKILDA